VDEPNDGTEYPASDCSLNDEIPPQGAGLAPSASPPIPQHAIEAAETYQAELDDLLVHLAKHPDERWVAYRGRQRLGISADDLALHRECLAKFPDGRFCVYGIDGALKYPNDTEV
jgi:hypothetical protein